MSLLSFNINAFIFIHFSMHINLLLLNGKLLRVAEQQNVLRPRA